jgi:hypothetical protein
MTCIAVALPAADGAADGEAGLLAAGPAVEPPVVEQPRTTIAEAMVSTARLMAVTSALYSTGTTITGVDDERMTVV